MFIALWIVTGILAALFAMAGTMKVITPYGDVREKMEWVETVTAGQLKGIGGSPRFVVNSIVVMDDSPLFGRRS